jgi:hypothetical protein
MRYVLFLLCTNLLVLAGSSGHSASDADSSTSANGEFVFENSDVVLNISREGGMFTGFILKEKPLNPFGWQLTPEQMPENNRPHVFKGHFLCTGRWGEPSPGEKAFGIPHNGEVNTVAWQLVQNGLLADGNREVVMECVAPIERLDVRRTIWLPEQGSCFVVKEAFTNHLPVGRPCNFVQHATVFAPFLDDNMMVHTNATTGFDQRTSPIMAQDSSFVWPHATLASGNKVDLRHLLTPEGFVTSHVFPVSDSIGWVTAYNPREHILLGYVFKTKDYPWLNYWHHAVDGQPHVRGLEFGTTGIGKPYETLLMNELFFFGQPSYQYVDAGEAVEKSWLCFQLVVDPGLSSVEAIELENGQVKIRMISKEGEALVSYLALGQGISLF